ncbi:MAG: ribose 5-phosphate isomerase B, partial [Candidatus Omnitrophota bacterium]|nr:ribose 5-phosphate isomerase B [Candidatus Omnitrophota bacterium]
MRIIIGSDHAGYRLKEQIKKSLLKTKHKVIDAGTGDLESCDYPEYGVKAARAVSLKKVDRGILICGTGIGMSMVANKLPGIRAALCHNMKGACLSREHNNANILVLAARFTSKDLAVRITMLWLKTGFHGGRHRRRLKKLTAIEKSKNTW